MSDFKAPETNNTLLRREFLKVGAAVTAGSLLAPTCAVLIPWLLAGAVRGDRSDSGRWRCR